MKKIIYLILILIVSTVNVNAQVVIGSLDNPHAGAILELKTTETPGFQQGFLLPKVILTSANTWLPLAGTPVDGMVVFNTSSSTNNDLKGSGIYVWSNQSWLKIAVNPSENEVIVPEYLFLNATSIVLPVKNILNLIPTIFPANATNKTVLWSTDDASIATVSEEGVVTAVYPGTAAITATTQLGGLNATCIVTVPVDKSELQKLVNMSVGYISQGGKYVETTFTPFKDAYEVATTVLASNSVTQTQIDETWNTLADTIVKLRLIPNKDEL